MWIALALLLGCPSPDDDADGDGLIASLDCDDDDPAAGPKDQYWSDNDSDGFGGGDPEWACEAPPFGVTEGGDCDDGLRDVFPGAIEDCDDQDDDCDGAVDDGLATSAWYVDYDGDGYGTGVGREGCKAATGEVAASGDCQDGDSGVHPGAEELCDGADDDCDGDVDEEAVDLTTWHADADGDGAGDPSTATAACDPPEGAVADGADCDDADGDVHPGALEVCDGADDDCDGDEAGCVLRGDVATLLAGAAIRGDAEDQRLGEAVSGIGDLTGDGSDDLVVTRRIGATADSALSVYAGPLVGTLGPADAWLDLQDTTSPLGAFAERAGDVDGSGLDDLLLLSPTTPSAADGGGVVWVLTDPSTASTLDDAVRIVGSSTLASLAGGADGDGDGRPDLAVGSPAPKGADTLRGAVWIVLDAASASSLDDADVIIGPDADAQRVGSQVAWLGDADGDGLADLAVASEGATAPDGDTAGGVWWFTGIVAGSITTADAAGSAWGDDTGDGFGGRLASAGDFDGDGTDDVVCAAPLEGGAAAKGVVRVFTGAPTGAVTTAAAALTITNDGLADGVNEVASVGDLDGDGLDDVVAGIGALSAVVLGGATGSVDASATDIRLVGAPAVPVPGFAGDLDGDGLPDLVMGSPYDGATFARGGAVWIFSGSSF